MGYNYTTAVILLPEIILSHLPLAPEATSTTYVDLYSFENDDLLSPKLILTYIENIGD